VSGSCGRWYLICDARLKNVAHCERGGEEMPRGFRKPTVNELRGYAREIKYTNFDADRFFDYYECCGWIVGKGKPMKDWRAAVRNWRRMDRDRRGDSGQEDDADVLEYARQGAKLIASGGYQIGRFYRKVEDALGPDRLERVKRLARSGRVF